MLKLFTIMPLNEIDDAIRKHKKSPERRHAQEKLAEHITLLIHGQSGLETALKLINRFRFSYEKRFYYHVDRYMDKEIQLP